MQESNILGTALLSSLSFSGWGNSRQDKAAAARAADNEHAERSRVRLTGQLLPDELLRPIRLHETSWRSWWRDEATLPWTDTGLRIVTTAGLSHLESQERRLRDERQVLVERFLQAYPAAVAAAPAELGGLCQTRNYPPLERVRGMFRVSTHKCPLSASDDWRLALPGAEMDRLREQYRSDYQEALQSAQRELVGRLLEPLQNMSGLLSKPDLKAQSIRGPLVANLRSAAESVGRLLLTPDPVLTQVMHQMKVLADGTDPVELRDQPLLRQETARQASAIAQRLADYFPAVAPERARAA